MEQVENTQVKRNTHHGHALRRLRLDRRISQKELGDKVGMVQQTVSHYEDEERISDPILERFAKALDVTVDFIKELEDEKPMSVYVENNEITNTTGTSYIIGSNIGPTTNNNQLDKEIVETVLTDLKSVYKDNIKHFQECMELTRQQIMKLEEALGKCKGEEKKG